MSDNDRREGVSPELDELSSALLGTALDLVADGADVHVLLAVGDNSGNVASYEFSDDGPQECLDGARSRVRELDAAKGDPEAALANPVRYAICYDGAVMDDDGTSHDALLLEFGERGWCSYSAYTLYKGKGMGEEFEWSDPAPAGELEPLL